MENFDLTSVRSKLDMSEQSPAIWIAALLVVLLSGAIKALVYGLIVAVPGLAIAGAAAAFKARRFQHLYRIQKKGAIAGTYALDPSRAPPQVVARYVTPVDSARISKATGLAGIAGSAGMVCMAWWINGTGVSANDPTARVYGTIVAAALLLAGMVLVYRWLHAKALQSAQWAEALPMLQPTINQCDNAFQVCSELAAECSLPVAGLDWDDMASRLASMPTTPQHEKVDSLLTNKLADLLSLSRALEAYKQLLVDAHLAVREATAASIGARNSTATSFMAQTAALISPKALAAAYQTNGLDGAKQIVVAATAQATALMGTGRRKSSSTISQNQPSITTPLEALDFLGLQPNTSASVLKAEIRRLRAFYHPDRLNKLTLRKQSEYEEQIKLINRAHGLLARDGII